MAKAKNIGGNRGWKIMGDPKGKTLTVTLYKPEGKEGAGIRSVCVTLDRDQTQAFVEALTDEILDIE